MHAPIVAAKAQVVFTVNPTERLRNRYRLRQREARLLLVEALNVAQLHAGQTIIQRTRIQRRSIWAQDAELRRDVSPVREEVCRLAVATIPTNIRNAGQAVIANGVASLHGIGLRGGFAAEFGEDIYFV